MKIAPMLFCSALAIFLATIVASKRDHDQNHLTSMPLDFNGIDTVEIKSARSANISFRNDLPSSLSYRNYEYGGNNQIEPKITTSRQGGKLLVTAELSEYGEFNIVMPSTVHSLQVSEAIIEANAVVDTLDVLVSSRLEWKGNAHSLHVIDASEHSQKKCGCGSTITIQKGSIDQLTIETHEGNVDLKASDQIAVTSLLMGRAASLSVSHAGSLKAIQIKELPGHPSAPEALAK